MPLMVSQPADGRSSRLGWSAVVPDNGAGRASAAALVATRRMMATVGVSPGTGEGEAGHAGPSG